MVAAEVAVVAAAIPRAALTAAALGLGKQACRYAQTRGQIQSLLPTPVSAAWAFHPDTWVEWEGTDP